MIKQLYQSKRFWAGVIGLITGLSLILTGEKTWEIVLPEILMTGVSLVQTVIALTSNSTLGVGNKVIN